MLEHIHFMPFSRIFFFAVKAIFHSISPKFAIFCGTYRGLRGSVSEISKSFIQKDFEIYKFSGSKLSRILGYPWKLSSAKIYTPDLINFYTRFNQCINVGNIVYHVAGSIILHASNTSLVVMDTRIVFITWSYEGLLVIR